MTTRNAGWAEQLRAQGRIIGAVLLQDMRTRFGRTYASYLVAIAWPLCHIFFILGGYLLANALAPIGEEPAIFLATGTLPYILCFYPARQLAYTIIQNRQLLNIPILKPIHLITARLLLELTTSALVCILFYLVLGATGIDVWPNDLVTAAEVIAATFYLAAGLGVLNVVVVSLFGPLAIIAFVLFLLGLYLTSGVYLPVKMVPEPARSVMLYNPLCSLVEWMRSAYFVGYEADLVSEKIVLGTASVALLLGLLGERFMRNKLLT